MASGPCQIQDARGRVLGAERPGDPEFPAACRGALQWHNFPTTDSGDPVPFFLCEDHRAYLRAARQFRAGRP